MFAGQWADWVRARYETEDALTAAWGAGKRPTDSIDAEGPRKPQPADALHREVDLPGCEPKPATEDTRAPALLREIMDHPNYRQADEDLGGEQRQHDGREDGEDDELFKLAHGCACRGAGQGDREGGSSTPTARSD